MFNVCRAKCDTCSECFEGSGRVQHQGPQNDLSVARQVLVQGGASVPQRCSLYASRHRTFASGSRHRRNHHLVKQVCWPRKADPRPTAFGHWSQGWFPRPTQETLWESVWLQIGCTSHRYPLGLQSISGKFHLDNVWETWAIEGHILLLHIVTIVHILSQVLQTRSPDLHMEGALDKVATMFHRVVGALGDDPMSCKFRRGVMFHEGKFARVPKAHPFTWRTLVSGLPKSKCTLACFIQIGRIGQISISFMGY